MRHRVASLEDIQQQKQIVLAIGDVEVGLFAIDDGVVGWFNQCPHMGGPVCQGRLFKRVTEPLDEEQRSFGRAHHERDVHLVCPWHGAEFDLRTGINPVHRKFRLRPANVSIEAEYVYVEL